MLGEINVTPLVDVVLVLLLVFMVTAPMMSRGIDVTLPVADQPQIPQEDRLTVSISADGRIYVGDQPVNLVLLEDRLRGLTPGAREGRLPPRRRGPALRPGDPGRGHDQARGSRADRLRVRAPGGEAAVNEPVDRLIAERQRLDRGLPATVLVSLVGALRRRRPRRRPAPAPPARAPAQGVPRLRGRPAARRRGLPQPRSRPPPGRRPQPVPAAPAAPPAPPQVLKPPKDEPKPRALPLPDARRTREARARAAARAGEPLRAGREARGHGGRRARRPRHRLRDAGPRVRPARTRRARRHRHGGDWYLAGVQQKIWMIWNQQIKVRLHPAGRRDLHHPAGRQRDGRPGHPAERRVAPRPGGPAGRPQRGALRPASQGVWNQPLHDPGASSSRRRRRARSRSRSWPSGALALSPRRSSSRRARAQRRRRAPRSSSAG